MNWYLRKLFAGYNTVDYKLPADPQQMIYDFYTATFLYHAKESYKNDNIYHIVEEIKTKLLTSMKEKLLDDVFFSINCELRHAKDHGVFHALLPRARRLDAISEEDRALFNKFYSAYQNYSYLKIDENKRRGTSIAYDRANLAMDSITGNNRQLQEKSVQMAMNVFDGPWHSNYGGEKWAAIARGWLELNSAKDQGRVQAYIDHIVDLQHNTGSLFNKLLAYRRTLNSNSGYEWIQRALDHKKAVKNPFELIPFCSPTMNMIASRAIKDTSNLTLQSSQQELAAYWEKAVFDDTSILDTLPDSVSIILVKTPGFRERLLPVLKTKCETQSGFLSSIENSLVCQKILLPEDFRNLWILELKNSLHAFMRPSSLELNKKYLSTDEIRQYTLEALKAYNNIWEVPVNYWELLDTADIIKIFEPSKITAGMLDMTQSIPQFVWDKLPPEWFVQVLNSMSKNSPQYLWYYFPNIFQQKVPKEILENAIFQYFSKSPMSIIGHPQVRRYLGDKAVAQFILPYIEKEPRLLEFLDQPLYHIIGGDTKVIDMWIRFLTPMSVAMRDDYVSIIPHHLLDQIRQQLPQLAQPKTPASKQDYKTFGNPEY